MKAMTYLDGSLVMVGDHVAIRRWLRKPLYGVVTHVYDPTAPSPLKGDNDYGYTVELSSRSFLWVDNISKAIRLIRRGGE